MVEDRRRRSAFENLFKGVLRYLDNSNDVKVSITELQERVEVPLHFGISTQQVAQQAMNENDPKIFEVFWQIERNYVLPAGPDGRRSGQAWSTWKEDVKTQVGKCRC